MSSKNRASKNNHQNSKKHAERNASLSSKQQISVSGPRSSPSHKQQAESSSLRHPTDSTAAQTSSSRISYPSNATSTSGFTTDVSDQFTHTETDLLEVSAWTHPYPRQSSPHYQTSDASYPSYDSTQISATCQFHASTMHSDCEAAWSGSGHGFAPLERWLGEHAKEGGPLALQLGFQLRADCTCTRMQDRVITDELSDI
ncbi:hypothetical protein F5882DRAFT_407440 [Hyaloscypha sp. PMI_1271]|nr:hypothetical protein F5882DRAFT_407440 [Hyaloscypha sp. PMI_1271]